MSEHSPDTPEGGPLLRRVRRLIVNTGVGDGSDPLQLQERLEAIERRLDGLNRQIQMMHTAEEKRIQTVLDALTALEKQISRAGREQLKANTLTEAQIEQAAAMLEELRADSSRRHSEMTLLREQHAAAQKTARLEVIHSILPALDGLDDALRSGQQLLKQPLTPPPATLFERMLSHVAANQNTNPILQEALSAWLVGLTFVRQRLLDVLAAEGVQPIEAQGQPFDPQLHIVMDVMPATPEFPSNTIAAELRRGYLVGSRVLRHAEVVVSSAES